MTPSPKDVVAKGYDEIADVYLDRFSSSVVREAWLNELVAALPARSAILELGCGAGGPGCGAARLAGASRHWGGQFSRQIEIARERVPGATFLQSDMTTTELPVASFDRVAAFYSVTHIPAAEQGLLLSRIGAWLKAAGVFVGSFGTGGAHDWTGKWLGADMFFSHNSDAATLDLVRLAGLQVVRAEVVKQDNEDARFLWIFARKAN